MAEFMFLGLRMTRGISKAEFERQFGSETDAIYGDVLRNISQWDCFWKKTEGFF